ncbi:LysE family translocator [Pseudomonas sp. FP818]|uniref:LysE family translocator n=1 Tax=Pseudomonas sp. FP818 TaxID=2954099 RepID=UPI0027363292|nr:LysE family transporter [Pseudomonas sp. FP818]WLI36182.1 LysE family transporter [Pseudomonas sp. FP818]
MQEILSSAAFATILSLSFGPVAFIIFRQSITHGLRSAVPGASGAAVADAVFAAVAFTGLKTVEGVWLANSHLLTWLAIAYIFYLGAMTFKRHLSPKQVKSAAGFIPVFLLTLTSPFTIVAISSYAIASGITLQGYGLYWCLIGFLAGSFLGQMVYAVGGGLIKKRLPDPPNLSLFNRVSGGLLMGFSVYQGGRILVG